MLSTSKPSAQPDSKNQAEATERRRQVCGLLLLAALVIVFSVLRAGVHNVFTRGWWRLW
jgi:hypothetical protein